MIDYFKKLSINRIAQNLLFLSSSENRLSLCHGRIGQIIFYYIYSRFANEPLYKEFADDLLDDISKQLLNNDQISFENGLCGIGWGIEFLIRNNFITGNTNVILEDFDKVICSYNLNSLVDISLNNGLGGIIAYYRSRVEGRTDISLINDNQFMFNLYASSKRFNIDCNSPEYSINEIWKDVLLLFSNCDENSWQKAIYYMVQ